MNTVSSQTPEKTGETSPGEKTKRSEKPWGILALCLVLAAFVIVLGLKVRRQDTLAAMAQTQLTQSQSETARLQTDLKQATAASTQMRSELDQSKAQAAGLQSQLSKARAEATDIQSQRDKANDELTGLQSQLDESKSQTTAVQNKLNQADARSADLQKQLDQAKGQSADLQARLQQADDKIARLQPLAEKAQQMPVTTSFEKSSWGHGLTLQIKNLNPEPLKVNITVNGSAKQSGTIKSGEMLEVEKLTGGQTVVIASEGYDPVTLTAH